MSLKQLLLDETSIPASEVEETLFLNMSDFCARQTCSRRFQSGITDVVRLLCASHILPLYTLISVNQFQDLEAVADLVQDGLRRPPEPDFYDRWLQRSLATALRYFTETRDEFVYPAGSASEELVSNLKWYPHDLDRTQKNAAIILGWSTFEAFAADIWIAFIEAYSEDATGSINYPFRDKAFGALDAHKRRQAERDISEGVEIGRAIWDTYRRSSLQAIHTAYSSIFDGNGAVDSDLSRQLDPQQNADLRELMATRHLIVHKDGIVDEQYLAQSRQTANIGERIELSRSEVSRLVSGAAFAGIAIIRHIDAIWRNRT